MDIIPNCGGVYCIRCIPTGKLYIGSSIDLLGRRRSHFNALRKGKHPNRHLQHAWNKYGGEDALVFEVLEYVLLPEMLTAREQYWMDKTQAVKKGFNLVPTAGSNLGMKASPETREKLRQSHLGQPSYWTGKKRPPETGAKISAKKRGVPSPRYPGYTHSPETREKLRLAQTGRTYGEATKRKLSEMRKGRKKTPESIEKTRQANLGRKNSPEAIDGMIQAHAKEMKTIILIGPDGNQYVVTGIKSFCREHHINYRSLLRVFNGKFKQTGGWRVFKPDEDAS